MKAPKSPAFVPSILRVFGKATNLTPNKEIDVEAILPDIIRDAGYDPDNLAQYGMLDPVKEGWVRKGHLNPVGLDRKIRIALVTLHRDVKPALTVLFHKRKGTWGLTKTGVAKARTLLRHLPTLPPVKPRKPVDMTLLTLPISRPRTYGPVEVKSRRGRTPDINTPVVKTLDALWACKKALTGLPKVNQKIIIAELSDFISK